MAQKRSRSQNAAPGGLDGRDALKPHAAGFKDERAVEMAKKNGELAFALVQKIAKAQNLQESSTIQTRFDQEQMQAYATQM